MSLTNRNEVSEDNTWDLSPLYSSLSDWEIAFTEIEKNISNIERFKGTLASSAKQLYAATKCYLETSRELEKIYTYAALVSDQDISNTKNSQLRDRALNIYSRFSQNASFFSPELLAAEPSKIESYLKDESLKEYKRTLGETLRYRSHTLSQSEEKIMALGTEVFSATGSIFSQLNNVDMQFESLTVDGKKTDLTHSSYGILLKNKDRKIREETYQKYYKEFDEHKNTLSVTLSSSIKKNVFMSRVRSHNSSIEKALFSENVNPEVYDNLISTVAEHLPALHKYYKLRAKKLNLEHCSIYDTYVELVADKKTEIKYDQACALICESVKPLGEEYVEILSAGLQKNRWVDKFENIGKRSGAYSSGCYDSPPYILMNYRKESLNSMFTLTHEAGHSMHSYFSRKHQPYQDSSYTIFVAEVASTVNEILLSSHLRKTYADDPEMQAYLVNHQIDDIKGTLFRQTMFAEFEKITHQAADANQAVGLDFFRSEYKKLLEKYFGSSVKIESIDELECLRIPHFYSAFYVYKYATGISAAISLASDILAEKPSAVEKYLNFLQSGCSKYSLDLLADAGVNLREKEPIQNALKFFAERLKELEELI